MGFASVGDKVILEGGLVGTIDSIDRGIAHVSYKLGYGTNESWLPEASLTVVDILGREWTPAVQTMRAAVMDCMHYSGEKYQAIPTGEHQAVRCFADGFGPLPADHDAFYDWSHVRDSSPEAVIGMYGALADLGYVDRLVIA